jgi:hypothetical protein
LTEVENSPNVNLSERGRDGMRTVNPERLKAKRDKLEAALKELEERVGAQEQRRYAVVGRAVLSHAQGDEAFREQLMAILDRTVSSKPERALLGLSGSAARKRARASDAAA